MRMSKDSSTKYKKKERKASKKLVKGIKMKKAKTANMVASDIKISQKMKSKS